MTEKEFEKRHSAIWANYEKAVEEASANKRRELNELCNQYVEENRKFADGDKVIYRGNLCEVRSATAEMHGVGYELIDYNTRMSVNYGCPVYGKDMKKYTKKS